MAKSDAVRIAELECSTQLLSQILGFVTDPLWSTIGGFAAVHYLRKQKLIGPVADDALYAGIIAINTARQPALMELAGKGLSVLGTAGIAAGTVAAGYVAKKGITAVVTKGAQTRPGPGAAGIALLPVGIGTALAVKDLERKGYLVDRPRVGGTASSEQ